MPCCWMDHFKYRLSEKYFHFNISYTTFTLVKTYGTRLDMVATGHFLLVVSATVWLTATVLFSVFFTSWLWYFHRCDWDTRSQLETDWRDGENRCKCTIIILAAMYLNWRHGEAASGKHDSHSLSCFTHRENTAQRSRPPVSDPFFSHCNKTHYGARKYPPTWKCFIPPNCLT